MRAENERRLQIHRLMDSSYSNIDELFEYVRNLLEERNKYVKILSNISKTSHPETFDSAIYTINSINKNINLILNTNEI